MTTPFKGISIIALAVLSICFAGAAWADGNAASHWERLHQQGIETFKSGSLPKALLQAEVALAFSRSTFGNRDARTLTSQEGVAKILEAQDHYSEAETIYRNIFETRLHNHGSHDPNTLAAIEDLAGVIEAQDRYPQAESLYREALAGRRQVLGPLDLDTLTSIDDLGLLLLEEGHYVEAETLFREEVAGQVKIQR